MKYEKTDSIDELIKSAISEIEDEEGAEFEALDDPDVTLSNRITDKIDRLIAGKSKPKIKYPSKLLSSAALAAFVTACAVWLAMMNAFGNLPSISHPHQTEPTQTSDNPMGFTDSTYTEGTSTEWTSSSSQTNPPSPTKEAFSVPPDEKKVTRSFLASNADGLTMEISVHGYCSAMLGKSFYLKSNEYFTVDVKIKNESYNPIYQCLPTDCREGNIPHNHEIGFDLSCEGYPLHSSSFGFSCTETANIWTLEPSKTYEWTSKLAAGAESAHDFDLPADGNGYLAGIKLYDESIYTDGSCTFSGNIFFDYRKTNEKKTNDLTLSVPLSIEIVCISTESEP